MVPKLAEKIREGAPGCDLNLVPIVIGLSKVGHFNRLAEASRVKTFEKPAWAMINQFELPNACENWRATCSTFGSEYDRGGGRLAQVVRAQPSHG